MNDRYQGKPLVRLLECYVLRAIGELSYADESNLNEIAPKLQGVYQVKGAWHEIIESVLRLPPDMAQRIAELWSRNQDLAKSTGRTLLPQHFAEMFVDQNFAS